MMNKLEVSSLGKKFFRHWVFRNLNFDVVPGEPLLITGANGSGKSTLTRILAGQLEPDEGKVILNLSGHSSPAENRYRHISWSGPYLELFPDLNLKEMVDLHFRFRECLLNGSEEFIRQLGLQQYADRPLKVLSSGMMARLKNALAVFSKSDLLLLDEPTGNLDEENVNRLFEWIQLTANERMIIFVSNDNRDFSRFTKRLDLSTF